MAPQEPPTESGDTARYALDSWQLKQESEVRTSTSKRAKHADGEAKERPHHLRNTLHYIFAVLPEHALVFLTGQSFPTTKKPENTQGNTSGDQASDDYVGDPLEKLAIPTEDTGLRGDKTEIDAYVDQFKFGRPQEITVEEEWITEGTTLWEWRQPCKRASKHPLFTTIFTLLIIVHSCILGAAVDGEILEWPTLWCLEAVFTVLYTIEIFIRILACASKPWMSLSIMFDIALVCMAIFDVFIMYTLEFMGFADRPNISVLMCFRLCRFTRMVHAAGHLSDFARPVRIIKGAVLHTPDVFLGVVLLSFLFFGLCVIMFMSSAKEVDDPVMDEYFATPGDTLVLFMTLFSKQSALSDIMRKLDQVEEGLFIAILFRVVVALIKVVLSFIVLGVFVEQLLREGKMDDELQYIKGKQRGFDREKIKEQLEKCGEHSIVTGVNKIDSKSIRVADLTNKLMTTRDDNGTKKRNGLRQYDWQDPSQLQLFGVSADDAVQLMKDTDKKKEGVISVSAYLLQMFQKRCADRSIYEMVSDHNIRICKYHLTTCHDTLSDFQKALNNRTDRAEGEHLPVSPLQQEHGGGMMQNVKITLSSLIECRTEAESVYWTVANTLSELLEETRELNALIANTDWTDEETVPDGAIKIASVQFSAHLLKMKQRMEEWEAVSKRMQKCFHDLESNPMVKEDDSLPLCSVCGHRHPEVLDVYNDTEFV